MKINLNEISTLEIIDDSEEIIDDSDYEPDMSSNGGHYRYWTKYGRINENAWEVTEHTTGEFCPYCGRWDCCGDCIEPEIISTERLAKFISSFVEDDEHYIKTY